MLPIVIAFIALFATCPIVAKADVAVLETPDGLVFDLGVECTDTLASPEILQLLISRIHNGDFITSWMLTGEFEIGQVVYGVPPANSFEEEAARELVPGSIYTVRIEYDCSGEDAEVAGALFIVDPILRVTQCSDWWHCAILEKTAWW